jgi:hypothetical protein
MAGFRGWPFYFARISIFARSMGILSARVSKIDLWGVFARPGAMSALDDL